ncbi:uncharacterized protein LOC111053919 [Nilaparvata lugens]|uniref:uncharacterized protein LOC111053919 n=1 Tax=Nilaparvata lugens TaxID=108931 RepID=UPI00193D215D|nr:uncharacterized protein LOC111053919 [Nilaparvata lugens]
MVTDAQIVAAAARWSDDTLDAKELAQSGTAHARLQLPALVKVAKGQYSALGLPSLSCPGLAQLALVVSAGRQRTLLAQAVKLKEGRRVSSAGARVLIPESYGGYFELLSEEGRAARCLESVAELARRRPAHGCLLRQPLRALAVTSLANHRQLTPNATIVPAPGLEAASPRTLAAGETLYPCDEVQPEGAKGRYLRCTDSKGETVLLGLEQRGRFSVLAREDSVSGVHTARNLLSKRLPLTVRLVSGSPPLQHKSDARSPAAELRLLSAFDGQMLFALPLNTKDSATSSSLIALPVAAPLKLLRARNDEQLRGMREFQRLAERATRLAQEVRDRAHVLDGKLSEPKQRRNVAAPHDVIGADEPKQRRNVAAPHDVISVDENRVPCPIDDYDEIDQIYDYVRGFAPLPKSVRANYCDPSRSADCSERRSKEAPDPPPIDTIPGKGGSHGAAVAAAASKAEKRTRKQHHTPATTGRQIPPPATPVATPAPTSLYVKNGGSSQRARILRQKSSSPLKETKLGSPLFNIRYKSLSNLQQQQQAAAMQAHAQMVHGQMETDIGGGGGGTLDSSHSGGEKLVPEKRFRRLSRPRSLTNLVWGHTHAHERKRIGTLYL